MVSLKVIRTALKGVAAPHRPSESPSTVSDSSGPQAAGMLLHVHQLTGGDCDVQNVANHCASALEGDDAASSRGDSSVTEGG